jgi:hypothetical protein
VSNGNRKFGNAQDTLPNKIVIKWLQELGICTLYTNDVIKNDVLFEDLKKPASRDFTDFIKYEDPMV